MEFSVTKSDRAEERRSRAIEAMSAVAHGLGIDCSRPIILRDSNNTIVQLAPSPIIAKVATTTIRPDAPKLLTSELSVGLHLASRNAPIAPPVSLVPPGPHRHGSTVMTLWELRGHDPTRRVEPAELAAVLRNLHKAFADYAGELPAFTSQLVEAGRVLSDPSRTPTLPQNDREFLLAVQQKMVTSVKSLDFSVRPLHGDPHLDGNILRTAEGPVFVDFESSCVGPKEWDLSSLVEEVASSYPPVNRALLKTLGLMRSVCVATWCWMQPGRAPEVDEAAHFHLSRLRKTSE